MFGTEVGRLEAPDGHIAQALAHVATVGLLQELAFRRSDVFVEQLQSALNSRIEQAKGALAQVLNISVDDAFVVLRDHARRNGSRLVEVSRAVLANPASLTGVDPDHRC